MSIHRITLLTVLGTSMRLSTLAQINAETPVEVVFLVAAVMETAFFKREVDTSSSHFAFVTLSTLWMPNPVPVNVDAPSTANLSVSIGSNLSIIVTSPMLIWGLQATIWMILHRILIGICIDNRKTRDVPRPQVVREVWFWYLFQGHWCYMLWFITQNVTIWTEAVTNSLMWSCETSITSPISTNVRENASEKNIVKALPSGKDHFRVAKSTRFSRRQPFPDCKDFMSHRVPTIANYLNWTLIKPSAPTLLKIRHGTFTNAISVPFAMSDLTTEMVVASSIPPRVSILHWKKPWVEKQRFKITSAYSHALKKFSPSDCFRRQEQGSKLYYVIVRQSLNAQNVEECSRFCGAEDYCRTFAFR